MWLTFCNTNHIKMPCQLLLKKNNNKNPSSNGQSAGNLFFSFPKEETIYEQ